MKQALKEAIILTAAYYGWNLSEPVLAMYLDDLEDLPTGEVIAAYRDWRKNPKNKAFPLPAQIRGMVRPEVDADAAAKEISARISGAIVKFGYANSPDARAFIGEVGWQVVERFGGWSHICQNHGVTIDPTAFAAQARELAKGSLMYAPDAFQRVLLAGPGVKRGEMQSIGEIMKIAAGTQEESGGAA